MTFEQLDAISLINDYTEHRFGLGPLEDSFNGDKRMLRKAVRVASACGYNNEVVRLKNVLGL